jgi:hypothetical protein
MVVRQPARDDERATIPYVANVAGQHLIQWDPDLSASNPTEQNEAVLTNHLNVLKFRDVAAASVYSHVLTRHSLRRPRPRSLRVSLAALGGGCKGKLWGPTIGARLKGVTVTGLGLTTFVAPPGARVAV